ncbi:MAG TPA: biotin--[acetyl-CoA-carboxylase] ligase [Candidatus Limnocylindrales bacterium]|nr:biotin--[acetyl-CoA-carboxylase] ligase [Candidatus Limnocylindrales bacterium]
MIATDAPFLSRRERFTQVGSTNDVVRSWLSFGEPEVCLAVADEQSAGRGRDGRTWTAPAGTALLLSLGFRPTWLEPNRVWQLAASVSLGMAEAAETIARLQPRTIRLKWPNDLVAEAEPGTVRKLAGVLGETDGLGTSASIAVVGIGVNVDWPAADFPGELAETMTSLRELAPDTPIDRDALLGAFLGRIDVRLRALRMGSFDAVGWSARQLTDGRLVRLEDRAGSSEVVRALRADPLTGALIVEDPDGDGGSRPVFSGEVHHLRLGDEV